jgi:hypothetical protein
MKPALLAIYGIYNIIGLIFFLWVLLYLNMYINPNFIPSDLRWENGQLRENMTYFMLAQFLLLIFEIGIYSYICYTMNKFFLKKLVKTHNIRIAKWTGITTLLILICISAHALLTFHSKI